MITKEDNQYELPIRHLKLSNGDQLVSYVNSSSADETIILEHPCLLNLYKEKDASFTYYFTRYMPLSDSGVIYVNSSNIVAYSDVSQDVQDKYIRAALRSRDPELEEELELDESEEDLDNEYDADDLYGEISFEIH